MDAAAMAAAFASYVYTAPPAAAGAVKLNFLSGITLRPWLKLCWRHRRHIEWFRYAHRRASVRRRRARPCSLLPLLAGRRFRRRPSSRPLSSARATTRRPGSPS